MVYLVDLQSTYTSYHIEARGVRIRAAIGQLLRSSARGCSQPLVNLAWQFTVTTPQFRAFAGPLRTSTIHECDSIPIFKTAVPFVGVTGRVINGYNKNVLVMYIGCASLLVKGILVAGGLGEVWSAAKLGGQLDGFVNFDPDSFQYITVWTALFDSYFFWLAGFTSQQAIQR